MNITDVKKCAKYYKDTYLEKFYILTTYSGKNFVLVGEKGNFPHLIGIEKSTYRSNGYRSAERVFEDILNDVAINTHIIPTTISTTSKMYSKILNFCDSDTLLIRNNGPISINYNPALNANNLNHVSLLLTDISSGFMMGWINNSIIEINSEIKLKKYCPSSWIDESLGTTIQKEKYMPNQDVDLLKNVIVFNKNSVLIKEKKYTYNYNEKKTILHAISRNNGNLLVDNRNCRYYKEIATFEKIHCKINGIQY